jgi:hypothetical protein
MADGPLSPNREHKSMILQNNSKQLIVVFRNGICSCNLIIDNLCATAKPPLDVMAKRFMPVSQMNDNDIFATQ